MKKLIVLPIAILMLNSCVDQKSSEIIYTIINKTDKDVKVLAFDTGDELTGEVYGTSIEADEITIESNSSYKVTRYTGLDADTETFYSIDGVDSVRIIFNNEKVKIYTLQEAGGTPDISIFDGEGSDGDYRHTITEEDYATAQDCDPDCESTE